MSKRRAEELNVLAALFRREQSCRPFATDINRNLRSRGPDQIQRLSSFFPAIGSPQVTVLLGFDEHGEHGVSVTELEVRFFPLRLSRNYVSAGRLPALNRFSLSSLINYSLSESRMTVLTNKPVVLPGGAVLVFTFEPLPEQDESWDGIDGLHDPIRYGTAALFLSSEGSEPILSRRSSSLSVAHNHHLLFRLDSSQDLAFVNQGCEIEIWHIGRCGAVPPLSSSASACAELLAIEVTASQPQQQEQQYFRRFVSSTPSASGVTVSTATLRADLLVSLLLAKTYQGRRLDLADLEVRMLGPAETPGLVLLVLACSILYNGGGKDLGMLVALDTASDAAETRVLTFLDLRKTLDQLVRGGGGAGPVHSSQSPGQDSTPPRSWLAQAADHWHGLLLRRDPRLRRLYSEMQWIGNEHMEAQGSLQLLRHSVCNVCVVHDEQLEFSSS